MPIDYKDEEDKPGEILGFIHGYKGVDTNTSRIALIQDKLPDHSNMDVDGGNLSTMAGNALHDTNFVAGDNKPFLWLGQHVPASGTPVIVVGQQDGKVYSWNGSAFTALRVGLATGASVWASHTQVGDYTMVCDPTNGNYKFDGSNYLPLGAKLLADFGVGRVPETLQVSGRLHGTAVGRQE